MTEEERELHDRFNALPGPMREAIRATPWDKVMSEVAQRHKLSEDQTEMLHTVSLLTILGMQVPTDYEKNVQEELGISAALADQIGDEFTSRVLGRIMEEARARGMRPPPGESEPDERTIYENKERGILITSNIFKRGAVTYPIRTISSVIKFPMPFEFGAFVVNAAIGLVAIIALLSFKAFFMVVGLLGLALAWFNLRSMFKTNYCLRIGMVGESDITILTTDAKYADDLKNAIETALNS